MSRDLLEKLAALAPVKGKRREGEKRAGPWTEENTQEYLEWTGWECADPVDYNNGRKWVGICPNNEGHNNAAVILANGWWNFTCYHAGCKDMTNDEFKEHWEEQNDDKYPYPKQKMARATAFEFDDLEPDKLSAKPVDTTGLKVRARSVSDPPAVVTDAKAASPVEDPKVAYKKANGNLARQIDAIMNPEVEKGERMPPERERMRGASRLIAKHLKTTGKLYN